MDKAKKVIQKYVSAASDLAEAIKHDIVHDGTISDETVNTLNKFYIADNEVADLLAELELTDNENNTKLN